MRQVSLAVAVVGSGVHCTDVNKESLYSVTTVVLPVGIVAGILALACQIPSAVDNNGLALPSLLGLFAVAVSVLARPYPIFL